MSADKSVEVEEKDSLASVLKKTTSQPERQQSDVKYECLMEGYSAVSFLFKGSQEGMVIHHLQKETVATPSNLGKTDPYRDTTLLRFPKIGKTAELFFASGRWNFDTRGAIYPVCVHDSPPHIEREGLNVFLNTSLLYYWSEKKVGVILFNQKLTKNYYFFVARDDVEQSQIERELGEKNLIIYNESSRRKKSA